MWWFDSQNPSGYATSVVLTSDAGSGTEWAIIQGSNKVQLSSTYGETVTVTPTGIISSGYVGDILITASALGSTSSPFAMTARRPYRLRAGTITDTCSPSFGYTSFLNYTIQDNLLDTMPTAAPLNEQWASGFVNDWPGGNNWTGRAQGSFTGVSFADRIDGEDVTIPANPMPGCGGNAALVRHWEQEWRVGSLATGVGRLVQTNTLEQHLDFGRHSNIRY